MYVCIMYLYINVCLYVWMSLAKKPFSHENASWSSFEYCEDISKLILGSRFLSGLLWLGAFGSTRRAQRLMGPIENISNSKYLLLKRSPGVSIPLYETEYWPLVAGVVVACCGKEVQNVTDGSIEISRMVKKLKWVNFFLHFLPFFSKGDCIEKIKGDCRIRNVICNP